MTHAEDHSNTLDSNRTHATEDAGAGLVTGPTRRPRGMTGKQAGLSVSAGVATAFLSGALLAASWTTCHLTSAVLASVYIFCAHIPVTTFLATLWWLAVHAVAARIPTSLRRRSVGAVAAGCVGSAVFIWVYMAWKHNPGGSNSPLYCGPGKIPWWWPDWIPL